MLPWRAVPPGFEDVEVNEAAAKLSSVQVGRVMNAIHHGSAEEGALAARSPLSTASPPPFSKQVSEAAPDAGDEPDTSLKTDSLVERDTEVKKVLADDTLYTSGGVPAGPDSLVGASLSVLGY